MMNIFTDIFNRKSEVANPKSGLYHYARETGHEKSRIHRLAFWDAQIVQSAASLGCKHFLSEDLSHGQVYGEVREINPFKE